MIDTEVELQEADRPKDICKVYAPTKEEYANHCRTHLPLPQLVPEMRQGQAQ